MAAVLAAVAACDSDEVSGPPAVPASLGIVPDSAALTYLGETVQFTARVSGGTGSASAGTVRWTTTDEAVVTVDGGGLVTARGNGTADVRASVGNLSDGATVRVEQRVDALRAFGDGQRGIGGSPLPGSVGVRVQDAGGRSVAGAVVRFAVATGRGSVDPDSVRSNDTRVASAVWTLGVLPGEQRLIASVPDGPETAIAAMVVDPNEVVARVVPWSRDGQWGVVGQPLHELVVVQALDEAGRPVPGALVNFVPGPGNGSAEPDSVRSDTLGLASTAWTLGAAPGEQTLSVAVPGVAPLELTATAQPDAGICGRTRAVIEELVAVTGAESCAAVTEEHLASVGGLILDNREITDLRSGDFAGLSRLYGLWLFGNRLSTLPRISFLACIRCRSSSFSTTVYAHCHRTSSGIFGNCGRCDWRTTVCVRCRRESSPAWTR